MMDGSMPEKPSDSDCCSSGCNPCIFDVYEKLLEQYKSRSEGSAGGRDKVRHDLLSPIKYTPFQLLDVTKLNSNTNLYVLQPVRLNELAGDALIKDDHSSAGGVEGILPYSPGQHFIMINLKSQRGEPFHSVQSSVSRAYTPISVAQQEKDCVVKFVIKVYENGCMSSFIRSLLPHDVVYIRGPFGEFHHHRNSKYVIFCAGTGVAPMYPLIKSILMDKEDETLIRMCVAFSTLQDILFRDEMENFSKYWNFKATIYLSRESLDNLNASVKYGEDIRLRKINSDVVKERTAEGFKILVCGSEEFNRDICDAANECGYKEVFVF